jgi:hypothetical protein
MSLAAGLWPQERADNPLLSSMVPVHTVSLEDDITIRAYHNCPKFKEALQTLYDSSEFEAKTQEHMNLLQTLAVYFPDLSFRLEGEGDAAHVPLSRLWNAFDEANVARHEGDSSKREMRSRIQGQQGDNSGNSASAVALPDDLFAELAALASWVEHARYGKEIAVRLVCSYGKE